MRSIESLRYTLPLLTIWTALSAPSMAQGDDGDGSDGCALSYEDDAFPPMAIAGTYVGFADAGYHEDELPVPGPIPLGISAQDVDSVLIHCGTVCTPVFYGTPVNGSWSVTSTGGGQPGAFLLADASQAATVTNSMRVLYLPPADLVEGETRDIEITARAVDTECGVVDDPFPTVKFTVHLECMDEGLYEVSVMASAPTNPSFQPKPCATDAEEPGYCDLSLNMQQLPLPAVTVTVPPAMVVGELRPLGCTPSDSDWILGTCGTPPEVEPPYTTPVTRKLCDGFTYQWTLAPQPGETGFGYFLGTASRTPMFVAITPGTITVKVTATALDGEVATHQAPIVIHQPKVKRVSFDPPYPVAKDVTGGAYVPYVAPHWEDTNDDGDASDPNERRFPVAFQVNNPLKLKKIEFTVALRPMPGMGLLGGIQGETAKGFQVWSLSYNPNATSGQASSDKISWFGAKFTKCRYFDLFNVDWTLGMIGSTVQRPIGTTDNKLYVTMGAPAMGNGGNSHTTLELACKLNDGQDDKDTLRSNIWSQFSNVAGAPGLVKRPTPDGFNQQVAQTPLGYWINLNSLSNSVRELIDTADGTCSAWSQLLYCCFTLQNVPAEFVQVTPPGAALPANKLLYIHSWTVNPVLPASYNSANWNEGSTAAANNGVNEDIGVPGQNNDDPRSVFFNHIFLVSDGSIYDAPYGGTSIPGWPLAAQIAWETRALRAFCSNVLAPGTNVFSNTAGKDLLYNGN